MYKLYYKRLFDVVVAVIALIFLLPLFVFIAILILFERRGPVFFTQSRVGRFGQDFPIYKFRTMAVASEQFGQLTLKNDARVTRLGRVLRLSKLDELPQLWNVLVGHMSLVGPRPEVPKYVAIYPTETRVAVLSIRPGITDRASLLMIDESTLLASAQDAESVYVHEILPQKLALCVAYVHNMSFWEDLVILGLTVRKIVR